MKTRSAIRKGMIIAISLSRMGYRVVVTRKDRFVYANVDLGIVKNEEHSYRGVASTIVHPYQPPYTRIFTMLDTQTPTQFPHAHSTRFLSIPSLGIVSGKLCFSEPTGAKSWWRTEEDIQTHFSLVEFQAAQINKREFRHVLPFVCLLCGSKSSGTTQYLRAQYHGDSVGYCPECYRSRRIFISLSAMGYFRTSSLNHNFHPAYAPYLKGVLWSNQPRS